jgi:hypothetical protein
VYFMTYMKIGRLEGAESNFLQDGVSPSPIVVQPAAQFGYLSHKPWAEKMFEC